MLTHIILKVKIRKPICILGIWATVVEDINEDIKWLKNISI